MNLIDILKDAGINSSVTFEDDIKEEENQFENQNMVVLILLNDDKNSLTYIVQSLMDIVNLNLRQAQVVALLAHYKGKTIVTYGNNNKINILVEKFEDAGIKVDIVNISDIDQTGG